MSQPTIDGLVHEQPAYRYASACIRLTELLIVAERARGAEGGITRNTGHRIALTVLDPSRA